MNAQEAISLALPVIRDEPIAKSLNLAGAMATFVDGNEEMRESRATAPPGWELGFTIRDYWRIDFPLWEEDEFQRRSISVIVDSASKEANILIE